MPITQSRMLALISAADDYRERYDTLASAIARHYATACEDGNFEAMADEVMRMSQILPLKPETIPTLTIEKYHFKQMRYINEKNRFNKTEARRAAGIRENQNHFPLPPDDLNIGSAVAPNRYRNHGPYAPQGQGQPPDDMYDDPSLPPKDIDAIIARAKAKLDAQPTTQGKPQGGPQMLTVKMGDHVVTVPDRESTPDLPAPGADDPI